MIIPPFGNPFPVMDRQRGMELDRAFSKAQIDTKESIVIWVGYVKDGYRPIPLVDGFDLSNQIFRPLESLRLPDTLP